MEGEEEEEEEEVKRRAPPIVVVSCFAFPSCLLRLLLARSHDMLRNISYEWGYVDEYIETHTQDRQTCNLYTRLDEYSGRQLTEKEEEEETTTLVPTLSVKEKSPSR